MRGNQWILSNFNQAGGGEGSFVFGDPGDIPVVGDWVGDGISRPGVVRGNVWFLRLSHTSGPADISFVFGDPGDIPVVGDWNGDGVFTPGMVRGNTWYLRNSNTTGSADIAFTFGEPGDIPVPGDWNGDGVWSPGFIRNRRQWYVRHSLTHRRPGRRVDLGPRPGRQRQRSLPAVAGGEDAPMNGRRPGANCRRERLRQRGG